MSADRIVFDEAAHAYYLDGVRVPGVTSILKPLTNFDGIPPDVLAAKADLGTRVHLAAELDDDDDLDEASITDEVAPYLAAWRKFKAELRAEIVMNERIVYHAGMRYAGKLDRVVSMGRARWMLDIKTADDVPPSAGPQTMAYCQAFGDPGITRRAVVLLRPDGAYKLRELNDPADWPAFIACKTLHDWRLKHYGN